MNAGRQAVMHDLKGKVVSADEVKNFYKDHPANWFLLEVQKIDEHGRVKQMRVVGYDKNKEVLHDLFDEIDAGNTKFIFVYASPDGRCDIG